MNPFTIVANFVKATATWAKKLIWTGTGVEEEIVNAYFLGPHPCSKLEDTSSPWVDMPSRPHCSTSPDGTQCLFQADFPKSKADNPVSGYTRLTKEQALAQRQAWDKLVSP